MQGEKLYIQTNEPDRRGKYFVMVVSTHEKSGEEDTQYLKLTVVDPEYEKRKAEDEEDRQMERQRRVTIFTEAR